MYIGLNEPAPGLTASRIYSSQSKIRELKDANFWNIFYDLNKVMVVSFWASSCPSCNGVAETMSKVADRYYKGPQGRVKFYHVQFDPKVNPKIYERFGFRSVPVVFFYYTGTGKPPTRECPLLQASLPVDSTSRGVQGLFNPDQYFSIIQNILQKRPDIGGRCEFSWSIDFYDNVQPHLTYLGRLNIPWCSNLSQIRLISRADLAKIYNDNLKPKAAPPSCAINMPGRLVESMLLPQATGVEFDYFQIEQQTRNKAMTLQIDPVENQRRQLDALFNAAKSEVKEQGLYIVVQVKDGMARLYFEPAIPVTSSEDEFEFAFGARNLSNGQKLRFVPGDRTKQVIGALHTHYIKSTPSVAQTTTTGMSWQSGGQVVRRVVHALSARDISGAISDQIVVYALEADQIHKAMPNGRVINGMNKAFNVLVDALESFGGKTI